MSTITALAARLSDLQAKRSELTTELKTLNGRMDSGDVSSGLKERGANLARGLASLTDQIGQADSEYRVAICDGYKNGILDGESGDGARQVSAVPTGQSPLVEQARRRVDVLVKSAGLPDHAGVIAERLLTKSSGPEQDLAARWALSTADEAYMGAFCKLLADPTRGHLLWTGAEQAAYQKVAHVASELKASALSPDSAGGFMVPFTLDPAIMLTSAGSFNPLRRISRVVQTVTDQWAGVTSAGVTAEWKAEAAQAADASPTVAQPNIPVHFGDAFVPYSFEVGMDGVNFATEIQGLLIDAADQLMATAYTTGTGSGQPKGITTALAGTASEINGGGTEALVATDAYTLQNKTHCRRGSSPERSGAPTWRSSTRCRNSRPLTAR